MTNLALGLAALAEVRAIDALTRRFPRHPEQWNRPHEADAEIVKLTALGPDTYLAATIDGIANEWTSGFFKDPYTAGWVLVQSNLSDLAAVGAAPIGLLSALAFPPGSTELASRLAEGIADALAACGVAALGGDLNEGPAPAMTACAIGLVTGRPVGRTGIQPGDGLWATGPLGAGNALAIVQLMGLPPALAPESAYRPQARLAEGQALRPFARAMMDTSDGPMSTLDHLARLNGVGMRIDFDPDRLVEPRVLAAFRSAGLPAWPLLCGEHGEYELMVAIPPDAEAGLLAAAPQATRLATATAEPGLMAVLPDGREVPFDGGYIRNLPERTQGDWKAYAEAFQAFGAGLGLP
ncbi:Thiamine-monophosphate kinase [compost metagenome]